jgi:cilia- and flagella-associated protein 52
MPLSSNGVICGCLGGDFLFVGAGDGKIKKISLANGGWSLTHEAMLDSKVVSVNLSNSGQELIVGTLAGKMYRILVNDFSFLLHSDSHSACINDISFGTDSDKFVAIDESGALKVWDLSDYKPLLTLFAPKPVGGVCCFVSKDDGTVMSGWRDGFLRCFDITSHKTMLWEVANAHRGAITKIYADANYILTGGQDGAVRVWSRAARKLLIQFNGKPPEP